MISPNPSKSRAIGNRGQVKERSRQDYISVCAQDDRCNDLQVIHPRLPPRRPCGIPIRIVSAPAGVWERPTPHNVSFGDLSCGFGKYLKSGTLISAKIPLVEAHGKVVWCLFAQRRLRSGPPVHGRRGRLSRAYGRAGLSYRRVPSTGASPGAAGADRRAGRARMGSPVCRRFSKFHVVGRR